MIEVREISAKEFGLFINGILIGTSKHRFDADHAKVMLEKALEIAYEKDPGYCELSPEGLSR